MNINRNLRLISTGCFLCLTLLSCARTNGRTAQSEDIAQETSAPRIPEATVTSTTLPTLTPELIEIPLEQSPTPDEHTPTVAVTATWNLQQVLEYVRELLTDNAECVLPCWWGIEPGKTTWQMAEAILSPLALQIGAPRRVSSQIAYDVLIPVPPDIFPTRLLHRYVVQDGIVQRMEVMLGDLAAYRLPELLAKLGEPNEVWIETYARKREGSLPFLIVLYYPDQGVLASFGIEADVEDGYVVACPQTSLASYLVLWSPVSLLPIEEAVDDTLWLGPFEQWQYKRLETVTDLDSGSFFETFRTPNSSTCIQSEATQWPMP